MPFVKLDCQILDSSLWTIRDQREIFITALLMAVPYRLDEPAEALKTTGTEKLGFTVPAGFYGIVRASSLGIIGRARLDHDLGEEYGHAMDRLEKEFNELADIDPWSKDPEFDGRRMVRISGGFIILNFGKYRELDRTNAERQKRHRQRVTPLRPLRNVTSRAKVTHAEAEALKIYSEFPLKVGKPDAIRAIQRALKKTMFDDLLQKTKAFAKVRNGDISFCPNPATWFNQERFNDDPKTWKPKQNGQQPKQQAPSFPKLGPVNNISDEDLATEREKVRKLSAEWKAQNKR